jgi:hypothetical protein
MHQQIDIAEVNVKAQQFPSIDELERVLFEHAYVTDRVLATVPPHPPPMLRGPGCEYHHL